MKRTLESLRECCCNDESEGATALMRRNEEASHWNRFVDAAVMMSLKDAVSDDALFFQFHNNVFRL